MLKSRFDARGRLSVIGLAACLFTTSMALAVATPAAGQSETTGATAGGTESDVASSPRRVTLRARLAGPSPRHVFGGGAVRVTGTLIPRLAGRSVRLEVRTRGRWRLHARTRTRAGGRFAVTFRPGDAGGYSLRVRFAGDSHHTGARTALPRVFSYRAGHASWYGPGFYGNRTACGRTLTTGVRGVAHKYLPCGTKVRFYYRGRSVNATVIDRGPFAAGREWDLTAATKRALGFGSTGTVWSTR